MPAKGQVPAVIIDANTVVNGPWNLESAEWKVLLHWAASGQIHLVVPEIVVQEVVGKFRAELPKKVRAAAGAVSELRRLVGEAVAPPADVDVEGLVDAYEQKTRSRLAESGAEVIPLPAVDLQDLVTRAIERTRPFNEKGSGFRDALIWRNVVDVVREGPKGPVAFISNDATAFADGDGNLHTDLVRDLGPAASNDGVTLQRSVGAFLDSIGVPNPAFHVRVLEAVGEQQAELTAAVQAAVVGQELVSSRITAGIGAIGSVKVSLLRVSGGLSEVDLALVHLRVESEAKLDVLVTDHATPLHTNTTAKLALDATATYDPENHAFADLRVINLPSPRAVPEVMRAVRSIDPNYDLRTVRAIGIPSDYLEGLLPKIPAEYLGGLLPKIPAEYLGGLLPKIPAEYLGGLLPKIPQGILEGIQLPEIPKNLLDQIQNAAIPPDLLKNIGRAANLDLLGQLGLVHRAPPDDEESDDGQEEGSEDGSDEDGQE